MSDAGFPKTYRLLTKPGFDLVFGGNRSRADRLIVVYLHAREEGDSATRLGLVVGKKVGNAIARNRVKRLLREAFRTIHRDLPAGLDVVVLPRPDAVADYSLEALQESLGKLVRTPLPDPRPPRPRKKGKRRS